MAGFPRHLRDQRLHERWCRLCSASLSEHVCSNIPVFPDLTLLMPGSSDVSASYLAGNNPAVNGTFKVVGNTGAIAAHAIPFANDLVLFLIRPNSRIAFGGDTSALPDKAYLLVSAHSGT